ncbi:hypothetical protein [Desulfobacter sp. UBA2225]|nr:hypothetical protein [Desulfobacter sp. UBA2225]
MSVLELLKKAVACHNAGNWQEAEQMYRQALDQVALALAQVVGSGN